MTLAELTNLPEFKQILMEAYDKAHAHGVQDERERCERECWVSERLT
jgi:hypothetical protein